MTNQLKTLSRSFGIAALLAQSLVFLACSSAGAPMTGAGGTTGSLGGSTGTGSGGTTGGQGGMTSSGGGAGGQCLTHPGSCTCASDNMDSNPGGACASDCQSVSCGRVCTQDCCVPCGLDSAGTKTCLCPIAGQPYSNCSCLPPTGFPTGLTGGLCSPQGYAATTPPVGATLPSLKGVPCNILNAVCFTQESTTSSERGCICMADNTMHCGSVNHWFVNDGSAATIYNH